MIVGWRAKGVFRKADGSVYDGDWHHDKRDGFGIYSYKSGSKYEGGWKGENINHLTKIFRWLCSC